MATRELQTFLTRYIRDPAFAQRWIGGERDAIREEINLSEEDLALIDALDLADLDRTGEEMRSDRLDKRRAEFSHFLKWLSLFGPADDLLNAYHAAYATGSEAQGIELKRFLDFSIRFVASNGLPDFLAEMARFCFEYCRVAVMDRPEDREVVEDAEFESLPLTAMIRLARPNRSVVFAYDCYGIALREPDPTCLPEPRPTEILFLKSKADFKRSTIWRTRDLPIGVQGLARDPAMLAEVVAPAGASQLAPLTAYLAELHRTGVLEVVREEPQRSAPSGKKRRLA